MPLWKTLPILPVELPKISVAVDMSPLQGYLQVDLSISLSIYLSIFLSLSLTLSASLPLSASLCLTYSDR